MNTSEFLLEYLKSCDEDDEKEEPRSAEEKEWSSLVHRLEINSIESLLPEKLYEVIRQIRSRKDVLELIRGFLNSNYSDDLIKTFLNSYSVIRGVSSLGWTESQRSHQPDLVFPNSNPVFSGMTDLFELLESKPTWKMEELEEVLEISAKTLYKQAAQGKLPAFRIGSCVRVYGRGLADHLRGKMKK